MKGQILWLLGLAAFVVGGVTTLVLVEDFQPSGLATGVAEDAPKGDSGGIFAKVLGEVACLDPLTTPLPGIPSWSDACDMATHAGDVAVFLLELELRHACLAAVTDGLGARVASASLKVDKLRAKTGDETYGDKPIPMDPYAFPALDAAWEEDQSLLTSALAVDDELTGLYLLHHFEHCGASLICPASFDDIPPAPPHSPTCLDLLRDVMREFETYYSLIGRAWVRLYAVESLLQMAMDTEDWTSGCYAKRAAELLDCYFPRLLKAADEAYDEIPGLMAAVDSCLVDTAADCTPAASGTFDAPSVVFPKKK
jgi:hypothetical protein